MHQKLPIRCLATSTIVSWFIFHYHVSAWEKKGLFRYFFFFNSFIVESIAPPSCRVSQTSSNIPRTNTKGIYHRSPLSRHQCIVQFESQSALPDKDKAHHGSPPRLRPQGQKDQQRRAGMAHHQPPPLRHPCRRNADPCRVHAVLHRQHRPGRQPLPHRNHRSRGPMGRLDLVRGRASDEDAG